MQAARIVKINDPLEIREIPIPKPRGSQVLIKVQSSGVCHSDIHLWEGGYAEYLLVPSYKYLVKLGDLDTDTSAPLSCSALTA